MSVLMPTQALSQSLYHICDDARTETGAGVYLPGLCLQNCAMRNGVAKVG